MKVVHQYDDFLLLIGRSSDLFNYFQSDIIAGLSKSRCYDSESDAYIAGLCNEHHVPFVFLNSERLKSEDKSELIYHEAMHQAFRRFNIDDDREETIVKYACETAKRIMRNAELP